jgi:ferrochelatase
LRRLAVVLFNLGGPDGPQAVRPFLFNLFKDPAIIGAPAPVRYAIAALIAGRREKAAQANYALMGGGSPILPQTRGQAQALEAVLAQRFDGTEARVFVAMRYWNPLVEETAKEVAAFAPDEVVLLPLYPQFSTTTTASSLKAWRAAYRGPGLVRAVCCYPDADWFAEAYARLITQTAAKAERGPAGLRLLFSAHGLPEKVVKAGDPYQAQVEASAQAILARLEGTWDWRVCYQSRVGPLRWIGPSTDEEIRRAGAEGLGVVIAPIAFVSEHVETLVELDHEYAALAKDVGCAPYLRAPALCEDAGFVAGLADAVAGALGQGDAVTAAGAWRCPAATAKCPRKGAA